MEVSSRHAVEESRTVSRREGSKPLLDDGEQLLERVFVSEISVHCCRWGRPLVCKVAHH